MQIAWDINDEEEQEQSDLFKPIRKEVGGLTNDRVSHLEFYLADVEAIVGPTVVIPDLGGKPNHYFRLRDAQDWREDFEKWLECSADDCCMYDPIEDPVE